MKSRFTSLSRSVCCALYLALGIPALVALLAFCSNSSAVAQERLIAPEVDAEQARLEAEFKEMLTGATLVGHFTMTGGASRPPREERYNLHSVEKLPNGLWLFRARIRYGDHDVTVPLPLPVEWAGNTPVIVVDNVPVPGLGTFDARVMFFRNHYAGYWSGGDRGGHLFGVIERTPDDEPPAATGEVGGNGDEE